jgi:general secretion pathway protein E
VNAPASLSGTAPGTHSSFEAALAALNLCDEDTLVRARAARERTGQRLSQILIDLGVLSQEHLAQAYAHMTGLPLWDGQGEAQIDERFPATFLRYNNVLPVLYGERRWLVLDDPEDDGLLDLLARLAPEAQLAVYPSNALGFALSSLLGEAEEDVARPVDSIEHLKDLALEAPIIRLVNDLIAEGVAMGASDIHLEPYKNKIELRYRVDGVLHARQPPRLEDYSAVVSRIKILSNLDIAERRQPQDGRIRTKAAGREIDIRVSTLPSPHGEDVVLRLLDRNRQSSSLVDTGLSLEVIEPLRRSLAKSYGMVIVTGPTGSGKTSSLYCGLREIVDGESKIITVEDPVEYEIPGITQIQVNDAAGVGFANALRSILRHDPDVVFIGEIRDRETAEIAVQAALTGHLVLSTVHTNDAVGAITRLRDMRIEPFLIASTLRMVIAQRLVRRLCRKCRKPVEASASLAGLLGVRAGELVYEAQGCTACGQSGYKGRIGLFEAIRVDDTIRRLINAGGDESAIAAHAFRATPNLTAAARQLVLDGVTTPEEAVRVARQDAADDPVEVADSA